MTKRRVGPFITCSSLLHEAYLACNSIDLVLKGAQDDRKVLLLTRLVLFARAVAEHGYLEHLIQLFGFRFLFAI